MLLRKRLLVFILSLSLSSLAAGPLADYNLNIYNPLVLNGSRCTGMGGAVVALGDDADDIFYNCAASSVRNKFQKNSFEWDYSLSFANVFSKEDIDYRNSGKVVPEYKTGGLSYFSLALILMLNRWSLSLTLSGSTDEILVSDILFKLETLYVTLNLAHELIPRRLYVAIGLTVPTLNFKDAGDTELVSYQFNEDAPSNPQIGIIYDVPGKPLKLGLNMVFNLSGSANINTNATIIDLPREVRYPFKLEIGGSWKFKFEEKPALINKAAGMTNKIKKDINRRKIRKKKRISLKPEYFLVAGSLLITGKVQNAVDIISYTGGSQAYPSGEKVFASPRLGVEISFPEWLKIRAGYYLEPPVLSGAAARHHLTFNTEVGLLKLFGLDIAITYSMDFSRDFWSAGISGKIWRY